MSEANFFRDFEESIEQARENFARQVNLEVEGIICNIRTMMCQTTFPCYGETHTLFPDSDAIAYHTELCVLFKAGEESSIDSKVVYDIAIYTSPENGNGCSQQCALDLWRRQRFYLNTYAGSGLIYLAEIERILKRTLKAAGLKFTHVSNDVLMSLLQDVHDFDVTPLFNVSISL